MPIRSVAGPVTMATKVPQAAGRYLGVDVVVTIDVLGFGGPDIVGHRRG